MWDLHDPANSFWLPHGNGSLGNQLPGDRKDGLQWNWRLGLRALLGVIMTETGYVMVPSLGTAYAGFFDIYAWSPKSLNNR